MESPRHNMPNSSAKFPAFLKSVSIQYTLLKRRLYVNIYTDRKDGNGSARKKHGYDLPGAPLPRRQRHIIKNLKGFPLYGIIFKGKKNGKERH